MGIDEGLISAYLRTRYEVWAPRFTIMAGALHPGLDDWLGASGFSNWAFITAWNPGSQLLPEGENRCRQRELEKDLSVGGWPYFQGAGESGDGNWPAEESFLVAGIPLEKALALGNRFGQNAILWGVSGHAAQIFFCDVWGDELNRQKIV